MSSSDTVPRTANLLACRQWWKVCFLYGDQEKYYRQIYGKAASQRIAKSEVKKTSDKSKIIFPTKQQPPVVISDDDLSSLPHFPTLNGERTSHQSKVTVLDDPFLFGLCENEQESDSGINVDASCLNHARDFRMPMHNDIYREFKLSEDELKALHLNRSRSGFVNKNAIVESVQHDSITSKQMSEQSQMLPDNGYESYVCPPLKLPPRGLRNGPTTGSNSPPEM
jgi:hypothetical protein